LKRAFTLIELLVVISIIAILASILFPVFGQAKVAAKAITSLSNLKQIALAEQMYETDNDDDLIRLGTWNSDDPDAMGSFGDWAPWGLALWPYTKNNEILESRLIGGVLQANEIARRSYTRFTDYGYNYTYLNPTSNSDPTGFAQSLSSTSVGEPSDTIQFTERAGRASYGSQVYWFGPNTLWVMLALADSPICKNEPNYQCAGGWGSGGFWANYVVGQPEGEYTGGVAFRAGTMGIAVMCDSHAKKMSPGAMAAGTNWRPGIAEANVVLTDPTKFLWSANR